MTTKAEQFRYDAERAHAAKPPRRRPPSRRPTEDDGARNLSRRAGGKAVVATEESRSGKPSRKSSRPSRNRGKNSTVLEYVARVRSASPESRHARR